MSTKQIPNPFLTAVEDGSDLLHWAEPNSAALADERVEAAVLRALHDGPVPAELACGVPLLRFADTAIPAMPLMQVVINEVRHDAHTCDLCGNSKRSNLDRLMVPAGASVVAIHPCWRCKVLLDGSLFGSSLVWD